MVSKLKSLLQVNKHPLLAEQICTQELGMLHFEQPRCLDFFKMYLKRLCYVLVPATASPNAPNKLRSYATSQRKMHRHEVQVWYPRQSLALDVRYRDGNPGITHPVIHAKDFPARALCSASLDYSIQHL